MTKFRRLTITLFFLNSIHGNGFELGMGITPPLEQKTTMRWTALYEPKSQVTNGYENTEVVFSNLVASVPIYRSEKDGFALATRMNWLGFNASDSSLSDLYDIQLGATYTHLIKDKKIWATSASYGSASDKPFKDATVNTVTANVAYTFDGSETETWVILLNYSNNRPILNNLPLPGFAYIYVPSKTFRGAFGAPFSSIQWKLVDRWSLSLFTIVPWVAKAQVAYSLFGPVQAFVGVDFSQMTFMQYGRKNLDERLYYDEKKAFLGVRSPLSKAVFAEIETGYAFGRQIFFDKSYTTHPAGAIEFGSRWYSRLALSAAL